MALTIARIANQPDQFTGNERRAIRTVTGDSSYPAGGYSITPQTVGGRVVRRFEINSAAALAGARLRFVWDHGATKLRVFKDAGLESYAPGGGDIKGSTNPAGEATEGNTDQAAAPVNSALLLAADTFTNFAGTMTPTVQPDVVRNVMITILNDSGGALDLYEGVTTFLITGTDKNGLAQTESVTLTSTSGNKSVANSKYRYVQGVKPFRTVTSVTITNAPAGGLKGSLGVGSRLGLSQALATATHTDVRKLTVNAANVATGSTLTSAGGVDTTNNAVNVGTIADGADVGILYEPSGEVATGTDLSGVVVRAEIVTVN